MKRRTIGKTKNRMRHRRRMRLRIPIRRRTMKSGIGRKTMARDVRSKSNRRGTEGSGAVE